ncbi:MAG: ABC transporter ATP-binding protein [Micromonosporaceae bacterium]|nr:ABC transporter ATP-binding protein [Micromonosporaceae bacterium]
MVIEVEHLHKAYGSTVAVDDLSFAIGEDEIFGVLGPNGAGKTTTVECVIGLRTPDAGRIRVLGLDPATDRAALHAVVGVQLQSSALPDKLRVGEILDLYQSFYQRPADIPELVEALGLGDKQRAYYKTLSGGQKQRLSIALALIGRPRIAVLDEMTTGLDPQARRDTWELIQNVRGHGVTIVLVTHFMDEAERLCDRAALIDRGRLVALGTPNELAEQAGGRKQVRFLPSAAFDDQLLLSRPEVNSLAHQGRHVLVTGSGDLVNAVTLTLASAGVTAHDIQMSSASLEDAFVALTGRHAHDEDEEGDTP